MITTNLELEQALAKNNKVYVQFSAGWCGPCRALTKYIEDNKDQHTDIKFFKVDVEKCEPAMLEKYSVASLPKSVLFENEKLIGDFLGFNPSKFGSMMRKYGTGGL